MKCLLLLSPIAIALLTGNLQLMKSRSLNSRRRFFSLNSLCLGWKILFLYLQCPDYGDLGNQYCQLWHTVLNDTAFCQGFPPKGEKHPIQQPFVLLKYIFGALVMAQDVLQMNTELSQKQGLLLRIYMYIEVYGPRGQQSGQAGSDIQI